MPVIEAPPQNSEFEPGQKQSSDPGQKETVAQPADFPRRHIGPRPKDLPRMLEVIGYSSLDELVDTAVPAQIRLNRPLQLPPARSEHEVLAALREIAIKNQVFRSYIGMGYHDCVTPSVIQRCLLENPGWYTPYTP